MLLTCLNSAYGSSDGTLAWRASAELLRSLLETAGTVIVGLKPDRTIFEWNEAAYRTFGYLPSEMLGRNFFDAILPPDQHERMAGEMEKALAGEVIRSLETPGIECNGEVSILLWNMTRVVDATGMAAGVLAIGQDVTERERAVRALNEARRAAEAANKARGDFLANMSHEIRTPLNGILGMTELVLDSPLAPEQRARLAVVHRSAEDLLALVNDVLDFSRIDAGRLELHAEDFVIRDALSASWRLYASRAARKGLEFSVQIHEDVPAIVSGDPLRLRQVINNLIDNAIKFTEHGSISVEIRRDPPTGPASPREVWFGCTVTDTGPGIAPEKQARIFEAFRQADSSITRQYGGTGLGLSICQRLVGLMGGHLWVESRPGQGSRFHFTTRFSLPAAAEAAAARSTDGSAPASSASNDHSLGATAEPLGAEKLCIWVAEDNPVNLDLVVAFLDGMGHQVTAFQNGRQLVDAYRANPRRPDLVLMDLQMPVLDGLQATREIREFERSRSATAEALPRLAIVALTAHARSGDRATAEAAGVDDYLTKPVRRPELAGALARVSPNRRPLHRPKPATRAGAVIGEAFRPSEGDLFDRAGLMDDLGGNTVLFRRLARTYLEHTPAVRTALGNGWRSGDWAGVRRALHTLRGSLNQLRATRAADLAGQLEQAPTLDAADQRASLAALDVELDQLEAVLRSEAARA